MCMKNIQDCYLFLIVRCDPQIVRYGHRNVHAPNGMIAVTIISLVRYDI